MLPIEKLGISLELRDVWGGYKSLMPLSLFVAVFGVAFGLAAAQKGLDGPLIVLMSTFVFAGAAQFAAIELWGDYVPIVPLIVTVFAINARHLLMGASLHPWLSRLTYLKRYTVMLFASDANWAMALQALGRNQKGLGLLLGGGIALWVAWIAGTLVGVIFENVIGNPFSYGLDMVMGCFLLAMAVGGEKNVRISIIWIVAACSSLMAYWYLPENSHVVVGALSGGLLGAYWMGEEHGD